MDKLNLLKLFLVASEKGSFASAASFLGLSPSTVSKAIARLEDDLQLHLFHRTTRTLTLTESGKAYQHTVQQLLAELDNCEEMLVRKNGESKGRLSINLPVSYGRLYVMPLIGEFKRQYPDIDLSLSFEDSYVDMIEQGIDICIRSGTLEESTLVARQLSPIDFLTCVSPAYFKENGSIGIEDYEQHPWIRFRFRFRQTGRLMPVLAARKGSLPSSIEGYTATDQLNLDPGQQYVVDDGEAMAELCAQGLGITQIPHFIARDWLQSGKIVPIAPVFRSRGYGVWMIYAKRTFLPARIRAFVEFLEEAIRRGGETPRHTWAEKLNCSVDELA
ncbi:LysR family transcriptional regulator [Hahella ganghwensis]|uniref:LysR family transcriptional regulator n=1 Tax=Hahella ganghwensis TaxID=286420 RepID=UPI0003686A95|nr:LysR family transcriptional regulator [Hahella ganghwensis]